MRRASRGAVLVAAGFLVGIAGPYLLAVALSRGESIFRGLLDDIPDNANVMAQMKCASREGFVFSNPYSSPPAAQLFFHPLYGLAGLLIRLGGASPLFTFHAIRVVSSIGIVMLAWVMARQTSPDGKTLSLALVLFGSGTALLARCVSRVVAIPLALTWLGGSIWEATTFSTCLIFSHLPVALLLLMGVHHCLRQALCRDSMGAATAGGALNLLLSFTHPMDVSGVLAVAASALIVSRWHPWPTNRPFWLLAPTLLAPLPSLFYYFKLMHGPSGFLSPGHLVQPSPPLLSVAGSLGATLGAALLVIVSGTAWAHPLSRYLVVWLTAQLACTQAGPLVPFERRLVMGCLVPAALLAGPWLARLSKTVRLGRTLVAAVVMLALAGTLIEFGQVLSRVRSRAEPLFISKDFAAMRRELDRHVGIDDVILCPPDFGLEVPYLCNGRPFVGHGGMQPDRHRRVDQAQLFFSPGTSPEVRERLLRENGIIWVALPPGTVVDLENFATLVPVVRLPLSRLYRVRTDPDR